MMRNAKCAPRPQAAIGRPLLKSGVRRIRRAPGTLQFGLNADRSVLLTGLDAATERWIHDLDGLRDPVALRRIAEHAGVDGGTVEAVLELLAGHGLLEDAAAPCPGWAELPLYTRDRLAPDLASLTLLDPRPDGGKKRLARRLAACVEVRGAGRVGSAVANLLAAAGVGVVRVVDAGIVGPADLGPAGLREHQLGGGRGPAATPPPVPRRRRSGSAPPVALIVLASDDGAAIDRPPGPTPPHLAAYVCETAGVIGPLVIPGRSPCLRCLDLTRTDRDPGWPELTAQLRAPGRRAAVGRSACDVVLATAVAAHACLQALSYLDCGTCAAVGGTLHVELPEGGLRRRSWVSHPACGCGWGDEPPCPAAGWLG